MLSVRSYRNLRLVLAVLIIAACPSPSLAADPSGAVAAVVGGIRIAIPAPTGYMSTAGTAPYFAEQEAFMTTPINRSLALFVPPDAIAVAIAETESPMHRYFAAQTSRQLEWISVTPAQFDEDKEDIKASQAGALKKYLPKSQASIDRKAAKIGAMLEDESFSIKIGNVTLLGVFSETPSSVTMGTLKTMEMVLEGQTTKQSLVVAITTVRVKDRVIYLLTCSDYNSAADIAWVRGASLEWALAVERRNK